jgi:protein ImuB
VRTLRTLALLDLESHPAPASIDRVTIVIDPTPGRVLQHMLFTRAHPTPEQISTLLARLTALMGQDRIGAPAEVDAYRPGAFAMTAFATEHDTSKRSDFRLQTSDLRDLRQALRRCRRPVPARVAIDAGGRPARVTTDRRGFAGGSVLACAGPWRTSGNWWAGPERAGRAIPPSIPPVPPVLPGWDRDEWDVSLNDGAVYRIFHDRASDGWFIDAIVD